MLFALNPGLPEIFLAVMAPALLMMGVMRSNETLKIISYGALSTLILTAVMSFFVVVEGQLSFNGHFLTNSFTQFTKIIVLISVVLVLLMSFRHLEREEIGRFEYPVLILFATLGMLVFMSAADFMTVFVGLEMQSLTLYIIVALQRDKLSSSEAGLKYFILGALSTAFLLYGISMIYGYAGTTDFHGVARAMTLDPESQPIAVAVGLAFILAAMAFKISLAPFHMWTPDVYEGSPTPVTAFLTSAPKIAAFVLWIRLLLEVFGEYVTLWQPLIMLLSIASMLLGAFFALWQSNIKRLLAYSTISHMGFALLGMLTGTPQSIPSVLVYLMIYAILSIGVFATLLNMRRHGVLVEDVKDLSGLSKDAPKVAACLAIFLFALSGIPPLAGFFAKFNVFMIAIEGKFYKTAIIGLIASIIASAYYLRIVKVMYFNNAVREGTFRMDRVMRRETVWVMIAAAIFALAYMIFPDTFLNLAEDACQSLIKN